MISLYLGGCTWAHWGIYFMYRLGCDRIRGDPGKAYNYLLDLVMAGTVDGCVLIQIATCLMGSIGRPTDRLKATEYCQLAMDIGYTPSYLFMGDVNLNAPFATPSADVTSMLQLLDGEKKGISVKDDRVLAVFLKWLLKQRRGPPKEVLGKFKDGREMASYYFDVLTSRGSPLGYYLQGYDCWRGMGFKSGGKPRALAIWEEADRAGLADHDIYLHLIQSYLYVTIY